MKWNTTWTTLVTRDRAAHAQSPRNGLVSGKCRLESAASRTNLSQASTGYDH